MAEGTQQHPLKIYFFVWILLFVLSAFRIGLIGINLKDICVGF